MKTKHKRLIIIGCCVVYGMLTLTLAVLNYGFLEYEDGAPTVFGYTCFFSIFLTRVVTGILLHAMPLGLFIFQFLIYVFVGWIIAKLLYPNKHDNL